MKLFKLIYPIFILVCKPENMFRTCLPYNVRKQIMKGIIMKIKLSFNFFGDFNAQQIVIENTPNKNTLKTLIKPLQIRLKRP